MSVIVSDPENTLHARMLATGRILDPVDLAGKGIKSLTADVVVVGTGAGGSACFRELALAGVDVIAVEAGDLHIPHADFNQREEDMMPRLFWDNGARTNKELTVTISHGKGVGGSTVHNICLSENTPDAILDRWASEAGIEGWSPADMAPVFERVRKNLHIQPISEAEVNRNNQLVQKGAEAKNWSGRVYDHNRVKCLQCGFCILGCAFNRKQSALITYIPSGVFAGGRLVYGCTVDRVTTTNGRATGISATLSDPKTGRHLGPLDIKAGTIVLAASAMMTPSILEASEIRDPNEIAGTTLRIHPAAPVAGIFTDPVEGWRGTPQSYIVNEFADFYKEGYGGFIIIPLFGHPGLTGAMMPGTGPILGRWMSQYPNLSAATPLVHDETKGRLRTKNGRLMFEYDMVKEDQVAMLEGIKRTAELYLAAGAKKVLLPYSRRELVATSMKDLSILDDIGIGSDNVLVSAVHPQGSVPMAADPSGGAVDSRGHHFAVKNLWVADGSLFPSSVGVPPQISIYSAGTKVAREILRARST